EQGKQVLAHIGDSFLPFSIRNAVKEYQRGTPTSQQLRAFAGLGPAPSYINQTPAEELAQAYSEASRPQGSRTKEQFERSQLKSHLSRQLKLAQGDADKLSQAQAAVRAAQDSGKLADKDIMDIAERHAGSHLGAMFKHLTLEQGLNVWDKASPAERKQLRDMLINKIGTVVNLPPAKLKQLTPRIRALNLTGEEAQTVSRPSTAGG